MAIQSNGVRTAFARAVSAEVRALIAAHRTSQRKLADAAGFTSHNYLAIRLRDGQPFTLDDVDRIARAFGMVGEDLVRQAVANHYERIVRELLPPQVAARDAEVAAEQAARQEHPNADTG